MKAHKRYLLFGYETYYPTGGLSDLVGSFDTALEAVEEARKMKHDYYELYDRVMGIELNIPEETTT